MKRKALVFILVASVTVLAFPIDINEARELLMAESGGEIEFISKLNLGMPSESSWIVFRHGARSAHIFNINNNREVRHIDWLNATELSELRFSERGGGLYFIYASDLDIDIMQGIPGTRLGNRLVKFGDFLGNGTDLLFSITHALGVDSFDVTIRGYDSAGGGIELFMFTQIVPLRRLTIPPIFFTNYRGTDGFALHTTTYWREGMSYWENGRLIRHEADIVEYGWVFHAWSEESRRFEKIADISGQDIEFLATASLREREQNRYSPENPASVAIAPTAGGATEAQATAIISIPQQANVIVQSDTTASSMPAWLLVIIIGGAVVAVGLVLLAAKRKT